MIEYPLKLYRGDTYIFEIEVLDEQKQPFDLTGCTVDCRVLSKVGDFFSPDISFQGHMIRLHFKPEHTKSLTWSNAHYDVQVTQGENVTTVVRGCVSIEKDITP